MRGMRPAAMSREKSCGITTMPRSSSDIICARPVCRSRMTSASK
jgi:hypothetical protein